jgi:hypothetical protein
MATCMKFEGEMNNKTTRCSMQAEEQRPKSDLRMQRCEDRFVVCKGGDHAWDQDGNVGAANLGGRTTSHRVRKFQVRQKAIIKSKLKKVFMGLESMHGACR